MRLLVGIDGDDTLWHGEAVFIAVYEKFQQLLRPWASGEEVDRELLNTEQRNLDHFGYGVKAFTLSMIETAVSISRGTLPASDILTIVSWAHSMVEEPLQVLEEVEAVLHALAKDYTLMLVTKGDSHHQHKKLEQSGLTDHFHYVEVVAEKDVATYTRILRRMGIPAEQFVMVGDSLRSDILPVVSLGATAIHIPHPLAWAHEVVEHDGRQSWLTLSSLNELPESLARLR